jgi:hypothetical protein
LMAASRLYEYSITQARYTLSESTEASADVWLWKR